jgi:hypothetical protein
MDRVALRNVPEETPIRSRYPRCETERGDVDEFESSNFHIREYLDDGSMFRGRAGVLAISHWEQEESLSADLLTGAAMRPETSGGRHGVRPLHRPRLSTFSAGRAGRPDPRGPGHDR